MERLSKVWNSLWVGKETETENNKGKIEVQEGEGGKDFVKEALAGIVEQQKQLEELNKKVGAFGNELNSAKECVKELSSLNEQTDGLIKSLGGILEELENVKEEVKKEQGKWRENQKKIKGLVEDLTRVLEDNGEVVKNKGVCWMVVRVMVEMVWLVGSIASVVMVEDIVNRVELWDWKDEIVIGVMVQVVVCALYILYRLVGCLSCKR